MRRYAVTDLAAILAALLDRGHGLRAHANAATVLLPELDLDVVLERPEIGPEATWARLPVGIWSSSWGAGRAWDQAVGTSDGDWGTGDAITDALVGWMHTVLPLFVAARSPGHPLADAVHEEHAADVTGRPVRLLAGPVTFREFTPFDDTLLDAVQEQPPSLVMAHRLLAGNRMPAGPVWLYTTCGRVHGDVIVEATLNNADVTEGFGDVDDHLPWRDRHGTVKSWVLLAPVGGRPGDGSPVD